MTLTKVGLLVALIMMVGVAAVGGALLGPQQETKEPQSQHKPAPTAILADPGQGSSQPAAGAPVRLDRYGDPLPDQAIARLGTTRLRHGTRIRLLRFTSDDKTLVSQGEDGVRIWDSATAAQRRFFPKPLRQEVRAI